MARRPARRAAAPVWRAYARVSASRSGGDPVASQGCGGDLQRGRATAVAAPAAAHLVSRAASASASSVPSAARRAGSRPAHAAEANAKAREPIHDSSAASSSEPRRSTARLCVGLACERTAMLVVESRRIAHAGEHKRRSRSRDCQQTCRCARSARVLHCVATVRGVRAGGAATSAVSPGVVGTRSGGGARAPQLLTGAKKARPLRLRGQRPRQPIRPRRAQTLPLLLCASRDEAAGCAAWCVARAVPAHAPFGSRPIRASACTRGGWGPPLRAPRSRRRGAPCTPLCASPPTRRLPRPPLQIICTAPRHQAHRPSQQLACAPVAPVAPHCVASRAGRSLAPLQAAKQRGSEPRGGAVCGVVSGQRSGSSCSAG